MHAPQLLKQWRTVTRNLSQADAAEMVGVHQNTWSDWENGRKAPRIETALRIAAVTDGVCPVEAWVREEPANDGKAEE
jgi:DNA-binding XRE family transcriptional regulator